jgi:hypothetical protein
MLYEINAVLVQQDSWIQYCTMLGVLTRFCPIIVQVTPLKTPFGLVTPFITIPITRRCNHTQLLLTPLHNYNPCTFMPTITYCTVTLLTIDPLCCRPSILRLDSFFSCQLLTAVFAGWLTDSLSSPAGSLIDSVFAGWLAGWLCLRRLARSLSVFAGWLTDSLPAPSFTLRKSCLKVGMCGQYSQHLVPRFVSELWQVG